MQLQLQVLFLISHSSRSPCLSAALHLSLLRVRPCQPPTCPDPRCRRCRQPLEACHPCRAQACHRQASCHLPLCLPDPCHPPRRPERRFPCMQGVYTTRPLLLWRPVRTLLLDQGTHKGAPVLQLQNLSRLLLSLHLQQDPKKAGMTHRQFEADRGRRRSLTTTLPRRRSRLR